MNVVGESGSGKTTTARSIAGLHRDWTGTIRLGDIELEKTARARRRETRRQIQYIFQNPCGSLNPRKSVGDTLRQPLRVFDIAGGREADARVAEMLEQVSLSPSYSRRFPDQLSGGERQRVQAAIVELLGKLQRELGLSMVFCYPQSAAGPLNRSEDRRSVGGKHRRARRNWTGSDTPRTALHQGADRQYPISGVCHHRSRRWSQRRDGSRLRPSTVGPHRERLS